MMEKIPENKSENIERPPRYHTITNDILEVYEDGSITERVFECNGFLHRRCVDKIFYGEKGEIAFAEQLSREELGPCDGKHS